MTQDVGQRLSAEPTVEKLIHPALLVAGQLAVGMGEKCNTIAPEGAAEKKLRLEARIPRTDAAKGDLHHVNAVAEESRGAIGRRGHDG
jgi:hypothetical protein